MYKNSSTSRRFIIIILPYLEKKYHLDVSMELMELW